MLAQRGPTIVRVHGGSSAKGFGCCFFRCCTCVNLPFLKTEPGILKLSEAVSKRLNGIDLLVAYLLIIILSKEIVNFDF